jgi:hypothetical protein
MPICRTGDDKGMRLWGRARVVLCGALFFLGAMSVNSVFARDDGFVAFRKVTSKHFEILLHESASTVVLSGQLKISATDSFLADSRGPELQDRVDMLFGRVCEILDMPLYSYTGTIKVCKDEEQLKSVYRLLFDQEIAAVQSFYVHDTNTVYICASSFVNAVVCHEFAHAIMSHYFVVLPPTKIQEILSGYVEFQLRKTG